MVNAATTQCAHALVQCALRAAGVLDGSCANVAFTCAFVEMVLVLLIYKKGFWGCVFMQPGINASRLAGARVVDIFSEDAEKLQP